MSDRGIDKSRFEGTATENFDAVENIARIVLEAVTLLNTARLAARYIEECPIELEFAYDSLRKALEILERREGELYKLLPDYDDEP